MELDDELCLCFHVTKRKVINYIRIEHPRSAAQLTECHGAGTGCGWCRPFLKRLWKQAQTNDKSDQLPSASDYASARSVYIGAGKGTPPPDARS